MERGVKLAHEARSAEGEGQAEAVAIPIALGLDGLHTQHEIPRVLHHQWRQAERCLAAAAKVEAKVAQPTQRGDDARGVVRQAWWAWRKAERLFDAAVQAEAAIEQIETARALWRPQGELNARPWAQAQRHDATQRLVGPEWGTARRLWRAPRTRNPLDWVHEQRAQAVAEPLLREA